jgi:Flp pilus assembly protein TadD
MSGVVLNRLGRTKQAEERLRAARALSPNLDQYFARFGIKP